MSQQTRGGEGQIVVRKISKRSKLILGAAVASALAVMTGQTRPSPNASSTQTVWSEAHDYEPSPPCQAMGSRQPACRIREPHRGGCLLYLDWMILDAGPRSSVFHADRAGTRPTGPRGDRRKPVGRHCTMGA